MNIQQYVNEEKIAGIVPAKSRKLLKAVLLAQPMSVCLYQAIRNKSGKIIDLECKLANPATKKLFYGLDIKGRRYSEIFPNIANSNMFKAFGKVIETGISIDREFICPLGGIDYYYHCSAVRFDDGIVLNTEDISDRKRKEFILNHVKDHIVREQTNETELHEEKLRNEKLLRINDLMQTFVFAAAHDLKAPLSTLKLLTSVIESTDDVQVKLQLQNRYRPVLETLENTIMGLLNILAIEKDASACIEEVFFKDVYDIIINELRDKIYVIEPEIHIDFTACKKITYIKSYLESIFRNFLSNALKYRNENKKLIIDIRSHHYENIVLLTFQDNGIGMDLNYYGNDLFKPFKRFSSQSTGSGIGLYLIKSIVTKNGGKIEVESKLKNGSTFKVYLVQYFN